MSKFLCVGSNGEMLNSDMVARIIPAKDSGCIVLTKDGQHFHCEFNLHEEVDDFDQIRAVIPCTGIDAVFLDSDGKSEIRPCAFALLMSDGKIEPYIFMNDEDIADSAAEGHVGFIGFIPAK